MAYNLNIPDFYNRLKKQDFLRTNNFRVTQINLGAKAQPLIGEDELVYAEGASLPGRKINNIAVAFDGIDFNVDGNASYPGSDSYKLTFRIDAAGNFRNKLEWLQRNIFNDQTATGNYWAAGDDSYIVLTTFSKGGDVLTSYRLVGASLKEIGAIEFKWSESKGDIAVVETTWSYHFYEIDAIGQALDQFGF